MISNSRIRVDRKVPRDLYRGRGTLVPSEQVEGYWVHVLIRAGYNTLTCVLMDVVPHDVAHTCTGTVTEGCTLGLCGTL